MAQAKKSQRIALNHLWVDIELLHWVAEPDKDSPTVDGTFTLDCLKAYITICAEAMRQAHDKLTSDLVVAGTNDTAFLASLGLVPEMKYLKILATLKRRGLLRPYGEEHPYDISYAPADKYLPPPRQEAQDKRIAEREESYLKAAVYHYEAFMQRPHDPATYKKKPSEFLPEDFIKRLWSVRRCDGKPRYHQNPQGVSGYVQLSWGSLFGRQGGATNDLFSSLTPEEIFLMLLLRQGTRPRLTYSVHPDYVQIDKNGAIALGEIVMLMCESAGFTTPILEVLQQLIDKDMFVWVEVPLANNDVAMKGAGGEGRRKATTAVTTYDSRHPKNINKSHKDSEGRIVTPDELLANMRTPVLAPAIGCYMDDEDEIWGVLKSGEIEVTPIDPEDTGVLLFGRYPLGKPRADGANSPLSAFGGSSK